MDSRELREMSIRNAKMALEQAKMANVIHLNQMYYDDMVLKGIDPTQTRKRFHTIEEAKNNSVKRLSIEDGSKLDNGVIQYEGKNLLDSMDNYSWKVEVEDKLFRVVLYRDWIDSESVEGETHHRCRIENIKESMSREVWVDRRIVKEREGFIEWMMGNTIHYDKVR